MSRLVVDVADLDAEVLGGLLGAIVQSPEKPELGSPRPSMTMTKDSPPVRSTG